MNLKVVVALGFVKASKKGNSTNFDFFVKTWNLFALLDLYWAFLGQTQTTSY